MRYQFYFHLKEILSSPANRKFQASTFKLLSQSDEISGDARSHINLCGGGNKIKRFLSFYKSILGYEKENRFS